MKKLYGVFMQLTQIYAQQLKDRKNKANYAKQCSSPQEAELLLLTSSSDWGVAYNGGRRGARFAPEQIINHYLALSNPPLTKIYTVECADSHQEEIDFSLAQNLESEKLLHALSSKVSSSTPIVHLGGGHDHIYPLLTALQNKFPDKVIDIINIDAHLDTRTDSLAHSGTPLRQFLSNSPQSQLWQIGIDAQVNPPDHFNGLEQQMHTLFRHQIENSKSQFQQQLKKFLSLSGDIAVISLDCDALSSAVMPAVSATSYDGLERWQVMQILSYLKQTTTHHYLGIYELNPLYDTLGGQGVRTVISLLNHYLR
jgi:formiminoglutamase